MMNRSSINTVICEIGFELVDNNKKNDMKNMNIGEVFMKAFFNAVEVSLIAVIFLAMTGCVSTQTQNAMNTGSKAANGAAIAPSGFKSKLVESLGRYMIPAIQDWGNDGNVSVYYLDANRFNEFKAELDKGGEYRQADSWTNNNRDWEQGRLFARLGVLPDGKLQLGLFRANNSENGYRYTKLTSGTLGLKLQESLRKYMAPQMQTWGDDGDVSVYYLDADRFNEFRAELDAGGEYFASWIRYKTQNRDWDQGKTFAQFVVYHNKSELELRLGKSDNSFVSYSCFQLPQAGEPKTIKIIGFNETVPVWTNKDGVRGRNIWIEVNPVTEFETSSYCWGLNPGQDLTFDELTFSVLTKNDEEMQYRWTGTGSCYISIAGFLDNRGYNDLRYYYSANGTSPTPVEIKDAVTTLKWSDFIREDY
jgi:hypothetical protein